MREVRDLIYHYFFFFVFSKSFHIFIIRMWILSRGKILEIRASPRIFELIEYSLTDLPFACEKLQS